MRILTYKRTHVGDPNSKGQFGINDCMGSMRTYEYDAVIGIGGVGSEPKSFGIDGKINWVGINPTKTRRASDDDLLVTFQHFLLLEEEGPLLAELAPHLAKRMYEGDARILLTGYTEGEQSEAERILRWSVRQNGRRSQSLVGSRRTAGCRTSCKPNRKRNRTC